MTADDLVATRAAEILAGAGASVDREWNPSQCVGYTSQAANRLETRHPDPSRLLRVNVGVAGWADTLHARRFLVTAFVDPALGHSTNARSVDRQLAEIARQQEGYAEQGRALGHDWPLPEHLLGHLSTDRASLATLTELLGSTGAVRIWFAERVSPHIHHGMAGDGLQVDGRRLLPTLPIAEGPVATLPLSGGDIGDRLNELFGNMWVGDRLRLAAILPESAMATLEGRPVDEVLAGLPIGRRRILHADQVALKVLVLHIERDDVPIPGP